jgi:hypothetical protein
MSPRMAKLRTARLTSVLALAGALILLPGAGTACATGTAALHPASRHSASISTEAIVIAAVAALAALACAAWGIARWRAFEPRWTLWLRHAVSEAGLRASSTWSEFADWMRLGH